MQVQMKQINVKESTLPQDQILIALDAYELEHGDRPLLVTSIGIPDAARIVMVTHDYEDSKHFIACWTIDEPRKVICDDLSE